MLRHWNVVVFNRLSTGLCWLERGAHVLITVMFADPFPDVVDRFVKSRKWFQAIYIHVNDREEWGLFCMVIIAGRRL